MKQGLRLLGCSVFDLGPARNRGWTYSEAIRTICVCHWSAVKQGWARFQCLFLCWSGVKQGLELFEGIVFVLFLSLVRRETGVGAIRENGLCHRSLVKQASGSPAQ